MAARTLSLLSISFSFSQSVSSRNTSNSSLSFLPFNTREPEGLVDSLFGNLVLRSYNWKPVSRKRCSTTVFVTLPTAKPERANADKVPKWSARSVKSFAMGELEARKLKYSTTGTEALLMGILVEGTSSAAKFLRANGITLFKVREEIVNLLGKSDLYFFSPEHPPLTEPAQRALDWAIDEKIKSGEPGEVTPTHLLLGIWAEEASAGHKIMAAFGFNDEKAKELAKLVSEDVNMNPN